jgi:hypothetical protein
VKKEELILDLTLPEDDQVTDISFIKIVGKTNPSALVAIYSRDNEEVQEASSDGSFSTDFSLKEGFNEITVASQAKNGQEKVMTKDTYYSKEELAQTPTATKSATKEGLESLKELVWEIKEKKKIKVYGGTIKGILAKTISLETRSGNKTIKVDDQTKISFAQEVKEPKLENILVGQFAIAQGEVDQSKIMTAKTLQIFPNPPINKRKVVFGILKSITLNGAVLIHQIKGEEVKINFDLQTKVRTGKGEIKIEDIKVGSKVALVGLISSLDEILVRKMFLVPGDSSDLIKKFERKASGSATHSATSPASFSF